MSPSPLVRRARGFAFVLATAMFTGSALAQVVLPPRNPAHAGGHIAPFLVCRTCGQRNYVSTRDGRRDEEGFEIAWCSSCHRDTAQAAPTRMSGLSTSGREGAGGLALPPPSRVIVRPPPAQAVPPGAEAEVAALPASVADAAPPVAAEKPIDAAQRAAAVAIFADLARAHEVADQHVIRAAENLAALNDAGLEAARSALTRAEAPVVLAAARVLLHSRLASDKQLVADRVRGRSPGAAGPALVELLAEADPVLVSPRFLALLLDSPHAGVRTAAERLLRATLGPELLPVLTPLFYSKQSETRLRALSLVAAIDDPAVTDLLLARISDPTAKVASAAVSYLAASHDPQLDAELLGRAFRQRWILRESSYALLALIEREDLALTSVLDESHAEPLLAGLESSNPFVAGTCAAALAGIGFRSARTKATDWLDQAVVDRLVFSVSGHEYHDDFTALCGPALRRLRLLSGEDFGSEGPRWVSWWLGARAGFYARRAHIEVDDSDAARLLLRYQSSSEPVVDFVLMSGTLAAAGAERPAAREVLYLTDAQAQDALAVLRREGVFGPERLPGLRGRRGAGERSFELKIAGRGKSFLFGAGTSEPWFERVCDMARALADVNRWQRYPRPRADALALWREESTWWSSGRTSTEQAVHLKGLVLRALPARTPREREDGLAELERLFALPGVAQAEDFEPLLALVRTEANHGPRVSRLVRLSLDAARAGATLASVERSRVLVDTLCTAFGQNALADMVAIAAASGDEFTHALARDARPLVRVAAAKALAQRADTSSQDAAVLLELLDDRDAQVERAAIEACGEQRVEAARTELVVRARLGSSELRAAALEAIGRLRGELVLEALAVGLADVDPRVRVAAARGLAELGGPGSVSLLVSVLGDGVEDEVSAAARAGLAKLGPLAWPDLLRVVHAPAHRARRSAALILAEQAAPEAASALMTLLTDDPRDAHVASELAILTGVDLRGASDSAAAWWDWWDGVVHDDALAWFLAALERPAKGETARPSVPPRAAFDGAGTLEAHLALVAAMDRPEPWLAERARRELVRRLDRDLGALPPRGESRDAWLAELRQSLGRPREE